MAEKYASVGGADDAQVDQNEVVELSLSDTEINRLRSPWESSFIIKLHGDNGEGFTCQDFVSELKAIRTPIGEIIKCQSLGHGFFIITLNLQQDFVSISKEAPYWFIGDNIVTVRKWEPNFIPSKAHPISTFILPTWVRLPELPIEYYDKVLLEKIGNQIGHFLRIDSKTAAGEYGKFARLCIQVDLQKPLPSSIKIGSLKQSIQYESLDSTTCGTTGDTSGSCLGTLEESNVNRLNDPTKGRETPSASPSEVIEERPMLPSLGRPIKWKYEVFVSFRGEDLRYGFASHLFRALRGANLSHYRDTDQGERGLKVETMLFNAIHNSKVALVLLSTNYADSRWCLDELVEIMKLLDKYKDGDDHKVYPIFFHIEPADVRAQKGAFGAGFQRCVQKIGNQKFKEWSEALYQVANLSGWELKKNEEESYLVEEIVKTIVDRISPPRYIYEGDGAPFINNVHSVIRIVTIRVVASILESIIIQYDDQNGGMFRSKRYGGPREGGEIFKVRLCYPEEYMISVSGHRKGNSINGVIQSIFLRSNKRVYGPYGKEEGNEFSIDVNEGEMIFGFDVKCENHRINSIAAFRRPATLDSCIGPFGSKAASTWDDGKHQDIRQIEVVFDSMVRSISIIYDNCGHPIGPFMHGDINFKGEKELVKLEYPSEYVTSISGFVKESSSNAITLQSLTIHTNKNKYGPFGAQEGTHFLENKKSIKIIGFCGRCSTSGKFESIRAHFEPISDIHPYKSFPAFGGEGGIAWDDGMHNDVRKIVVEWGTNCIDSVCFSYDQEEGCMEAMRHGGTGGVTRHEVTLDPEEYIIRVSGCYSKHENEDVIKSLTFESNKRTLGPYGGDQDGEEAYFMSPPNLGKVVGFYGRSSQYLVSIGAYFKPNFDKYPLRKFGPFGSDDGGRGWDDEIHTGIRRIDIHYGRHIGSFGCVYDDDGQPAEVAHHTVEGEFRTTLYSVELDYPSEYIVSVSGYAVHYKSYIIISSLTFRTNYNKIHGPIGTEDGVPFSFESNIGKIVGFYGRTGGFLDTIGVHVGILDAQEPGKSMAKKEKEKDICSMDNGSRNGRHSS